MAAIGKQSKRIIYSVYTYLKDLVLLNPTVTVGEAFSKTQLATGQACGVSARTVQRVCEEVYQTESVRDPKCHPCVASLNTEDRPDLQDVIASWTVKDVTDSKDFPVCRKNNEKVCLKVKSMQRQNANGTLPLSEATEGESSSSIKREELAGLCSSQPDPTAPVDAAESPPPKVAKLSKPKVDKVPAPSLIIDGRRQRKVTQPFTPVSKVTKSPKLTTVDYEFEGKRLVNMGYFIKSLQTLNDHNDRKCNFSDMRVCAEKKDGWNVGIVFQCRLCPTAKVIWMEDPSAEEAPSSPIIFKPKLKLTKSNVAGLQPMQHTSLLQAPTASKTQRPTMLAKLPVPPPPPQMQKRARPYWSMRKTPTPPPDDDIIPGHMHQPQATMQTGPLSNFSKMVSMRPNSTLPYGLPQTPYPGQLKVRPLIYQQVPSVTQSQVVGQSQGSVIGQTQLIQQMSTSVVGQPQAHSIDQSQIPLIDFPQVASIKQELILPDDGTIPSFINSSSEPTRVEMSFCVDQGENTAELGSAPSGSYSAMDVARDITPTPDALAQTQTSLLLSSQLSSTALDVNTNHGIAPADALPVDLNLVKKEVDDETP